MGDIWITDMSHFDYPEEEADRVPREAARIARYFASIVEGTVGAPGFGGATGVRCRRRPGRLPCSGVMLSELHPSGHEVRWRCPVCGDTTASSRTGPVRDGTRRGRRSGIDPASPAKPSEYETIMGTIAWDDRAESQLPKIVTAEGKEHRWVELGKRLMSCEEWRVRIEVR